MLLLQSKGFLKSFFDLKHAKDTVTVAFKKGPNQRRLKAIMVLAGIVFVDGPAYGKKHITLIKFKISLMYITNKVGLTMLPCGGQPRLKIASL